MTTDSSSVDANGAARALDYEQTVGMVRLLTDVRFKLAAFVPILTGGAVGLLSASDLDQLARATLAVGGLIFALGIVIYDQRNSQLYNAACGRAKALEILLALDVCDTDTRPGLFGSRHDTNNAMDESQERRLFGVPIKVRRSRLFGMPVRHGTGLSLVYTATLAAWVWLLLSSVAAGAFSDANWARYVALATTAVLAVVAFLALFSHDPPV